MDTIPQVAERIQRLMTTTAEKLGRATGFIKRQRQLSGAQFAQALVFGWMGEPAMSLSAMSQAAANSGAVISRQGMDQRFTEAAADFMQALLEAAVQEVVQGPRVSAQVFAELSGVYVLDSTCIDLPEALSSVWPGCGGSRGESACLKISVLWEMLHGGLEAIELLAGKRHDQHAQAAQQTLPQNSLRLADLGYYKLDRLASMSRHDTYWISQYKNGTVLWVNEQRLDLLAFLQASPQSMIDVPIQLGLRLRLPARLIATRVSEATLNRRQTKLAEWQRKKQCRASAQAWSLLAWDIYLTNLPASLSAEVVLALAHYRWQIELLFKLWKSEGQLDEWRTQNPWRVLCEIYAKLIALLFQHWFLLLGTWQRLDRSPTRALNTTRHFAWLLARELTSPRALCRAITNLVRCLRTLRMEKNKASPRTFQRLEALT